MPDQGYSAQVAASVWFSILVRQIVLQGVFHHIWFRQQVHVVEFFMKGYFSY